ncbi:MAG: hypothetical protein QF486_04230 [Candidatus Woesearchaeota archaeon]|jgi:hypothetical protein|nr:hypothetical protein [Candidatus Woesearchaeota archaeon]MDP7181710.1 hypothetical protein [Candidatus Woesearchaeota archaeon]MDP7198799.1 hypothetical protein [Candidatus Woesearchaeota archaeon]MDP7467201.1 hypothetical protein [Candidatus Woesearchaeota archaeon]MDP7647464.1 hypothetical protein [Candidatus Woesearchaeota archaeon]
MSQHIWKGNIYGVGSTAVNAQLELQEKLDKQQEKCAAENCADPTLAWESATYRCIGRQPHVGVANLTEFEVVSSKGWEDLEVRAQQATMGKLNEYFTAYTVIASVPLTGEQMVATASLHGEQKDQPSGCQD